jgi:lysophospholipase L1-like esterase
MTTTSWSVFISTLMLAGRLSAQAADSPALAAPLVPNTRSSPINWLARHEGFVAEAKRGGIDLLFLGDSITDAWRSRGSNVWHKFYAPRHAANFGIGGDRTQHVLWRIQHGELEGLSPKVTVLMIGTNNSRNDQPEDIAEAIKLIVKEIRARCPRTKVLLLAVFPRNTRNDTPEQIATNRKVNEIIAKLDDGKAVRFLDINKVFLGPDGKVPATIMPDFLHPNEHGYKLWADAMEPTLAQMMQ